MEIKNKYFQDYTVKDFNRSYGYAENFCRSLCKNNGSLYVNSTFARLMPLILNILYLSIFFCILTQKLGFHQTISNLFKSENILILS
jgi:hypothetical protein